MRNAKYGERNALPAGVKLKTQKCLKENEPEKAAFNSGANKNIRLRSRWPDLDSDSAASRKPELQ